MYWDDKYPGEVCSQYAQVVFLVQFKDLNHYHEMSGMVLGILNKYLNEDTCNILYYYWRFRIQTHS